MSNASQMTCASHDPIAALIAARDGGSKDPATLAFIVSVEGPSYRPVGAAMTIMADGARVGTLSSGCIEADIAAHAKLRQGEGQPKVIRYGRGSPYIDIQLPCGGGMDVLLLPRPDPTALKAVQGHRLARRACVLEIDIASGAMAVELAKEDSVTSLQDGTFRVLFTPEIRVLIFGKGPEATAFAKLAQSVDVPNVLISPDAETRNAAAISGTPVRHLTGPQFPDDLEVDDRTAIVLFFHDHEWEPPVLVGALASNAFYIGAQGSQRARDARRMALAGLGVAQADQDRLHGPIGLIPSARDATTLAVSVLAEVLAVAMQPKP